MPDTQSTRTLPCGCHVGDYKTYSGGTAVIVDAVGPECHASSHRLHAVLSMIGVIVHDGDADTETAA